MAAALVSPLLLLGGLSRGNRPGRSQGDFKVVEHGASYRALGFLGALLLMPFLQVEQDDSTSP